MDNPYSNILLKELVDEIIISGPFSQLALSAIYWPSMQETEFSRNRKLCGEITFWDENIIWGFDIQSHYSKLEEYMQSVWIEQS